MSELEKFQIALDLLQIAFYNVKESGGEEKVKYEKTYREARHLVEYMFINALHP